MDPVRYRSRPSLERPILIGAFEGWNDAAEAATDAVGFLHREWDAAEFASLDPEPFYDFQMHRPTIALTETGARRIDWPQTAFASAHIAGSDHDAVLLEGIEPSMRWQAYCEAVLDVAKSTGVELVVTMGALLANRPHTRPVKVTGTALDPELAERLGLQRSRYEGPTGITGVLHDTFARADVAAVSLWAWIPVYLQSTPSPPATLELVRRFSALLDVKVDVSDLESASEVYMERVNEAVRSDPDVAAQVDELERVADTEEFEEIPSGEQLAAEFERFLKDVGGEEEGGGG